MKLNSAVLVMWNQYRPFNSEALSLSGGARKIIVEDPWSQWFRDGFFMFLIVLVGHFRNLTFGKPHFPSAGWGGRRRPANSLSRWFLIRGFTFACIWFVQIDGSCRRSGISVVFIQPVLNILGLDRYPVMEWLVLPDIMWSGPAS